MKHILITILFLGAHLSHAETYKELKALAFSENQEMAVRWKALMQMTQMKKHESIVDLKKALASTTWYMRNAGLVALDSINPEMAYDEAKKQLQDPALVVRSAAVDVLAKNKKKTAEVRELLWKELSSKKNRVKSQSLWIRPQISKYLAEKPLTIEREKFLSLVEEKEESDAEVRASAEKALQKLQGE